MSVACRLCGAPAAECFEAHDWNRRLSNETFTYYRCPACRVIFLSPIPTDLERYYPSEYYPIPATIAELAANSQLERYKVEIVRRFAHSGRLLEIGPGAGGFAFLAKEAGFQVETIEMDQRVCDFLVNAVQVRVIRSANAPGVLVDPAVYDVVALWHVLEHLADPWETLAAVARSLVPGGIVVIAAPNSEALQFRIFGRRWAHVDAPRHLQLMPIGAIEQQAAALGLRMVLSTTTDKGSLGWDRFGWQCSLAILAGRSAMPVPILMRILGLGLWLIAQPLERSGRRGATYTLVFQKQRL